MTTRPAVFSRSEISRAIRAAKDAGVNVARVELEPSLGKIVLVACEPEKSHRDSENEWDSVK